MDAKELNALVHDREAAFYDDRFLIAFDGRVARDVRRDLQRVAGMEVRARRALDLACGTGYAAIGLAVAGIAEEIHASDLSVKMLERCRDNARTAGAEVHVALADAERVPYADDAFDLVVARGALHHVPDPTGMLREIRRVLSPGGTAIVLAEPTASGERQVAAVVGTAYRAVETIRKLRRRAKDLEHEQWEMASIAANLHTFAPGDVERLAREAGFDEIRVGTASWAWVLTLGLNYYLVGESAWLARSGVARAASHRASGPSMSERLTFAWRDGELSGARHPAEGERRATFVLAHGAGGDMNHPQLVAFGDGLAACGIEVIRFNFPYREAGRKAPDPQEKLEACYWAVAKEVSTTADRLYLGGGSMGGRIASQITADGFPAAGLIFQSYPLHPPGKPERLRDAHLKRIAVPMLFVWGTKDPFARPDLLEATLATLPNATLHRIEGGDHGLKVSGRKPAEVVDEVVRVISDWIG
jgi:predicted alpha/beta-hydrolase family hydrolase/ubiquinone/menaquinone biosynthesis C-methylase UbiE